MENYTIQSPGRDTQKFIQGIQCVQVIRHTNQSGTVLYEIARGRKILLVFLFFSYAFYTNCIPLYNYKDSKMNFQHHLQTQVRL